MNKIKYKNIKWTHQIKLPNGETTPGEWLPSAEEYGLTKIDFKNKRVLDVGCLDGFYSFYAEEQGAREVVSIDVNDVNEGQFNKDLNPDNYTHTGYLYAHEKLKSKAKYIFPYSVYDLDSKFIGKFDIVLFLGVIYHLAHPALALEKINNVMKLNGILVVEGQVSETYTQFYHKLKFNLEKNENGKRNFVNRKSSTNLSFIKKIISYFFSMPLTHKIDMIEFFIITKIRFLVWIILKPILYEKKDVFKNDVSNFWIMEPKVLERMIDFIGFGIDSIVVNSLADRRTYVCSKKSEIDKIYAHRVNYSNQKTISNLNIKNYLSLL